LLIDFSGYGRCHLARYFAYFTDLRKIAGGGDRLHNQVIDFFDFKEQAAFPLPPLVAGKCRVGKPAGALLPPHGLPGNRGSQSRCWQPIAATRAPAAPDPQPFDNYINC
jgi:hypothetical protein